MVELIRTTLSHLFERDFKEFSCKHVDPFTQIHALQRDSQARWRFGNGFATVEVLYIEVGDLFTDNQNL